jgi:hypothetical protein
MLKPTLTVISTNVPNTLAKARAVSCMPCGVCVSAIKKTLFHPKADAVKRVEFAAKLHQYEQVERRPIIYMDESGFSVDAPRERGYSFRGRRCYGGKDWHSRGKVNAIGAVRHFTIFNICLFEGNINAGIFHTWTADQLIPSLPERSVIVMDNAAFHQTGERFSVPIRTLFKWKNRIEPRLHRNKPATRIDMEALQKHVEDYPDSYQRERAEHFGVSPGCILYALRRLRISNKKHTVSSQSRCSKKS